MATTKKKVNRRDTGSDKERVASGKGVAPRLGTSGMAKINRNPAKTKSKDIDQYYSEKQSSKNANPYKKKVAKKK